jgi:hypothetical protein
MTPAEFVARLHNHYGPPEHAPDAKALIADYRAALAGTDPAVLQAASDRLIRAHQYRNWPTVGECREAVTVACADHARKHRRYEPPAARVEPSAESKARVQALVDGVRARLRGAA